MTIYNPARFSVNNLEKTFHLMDSYPFATVISISGGVPMISHLPLVTKFDEGKFMLIGHLARANPHAKVLAEDIKVTVIFHGPHAFITPQWYAHDDVPTWNYATVHVTGKVAMIEDHDGILNPMMCFESFSAERSSGT